MPIEFSGGAETLQPGRHLVTVAEIEESLVAAVPTSKTRRPLFRRWLAVREAIQRMVPVEREWVDGSYVTTKVDPRDIDVVSHIDGEKLDELDAADQALLAGLISGRKSQALHGCDSYPLAVYPEGHEKRGAYEAALNYWDRWWSHDRDGVPKGYLELSDD